MNSKPQLTVIKIGGDIVSDDVLLASFYNHFRQTSGAKILVHGGGNKASEIQEKLGIIPKKIDGRRITDASTLEVVTMVYAGLLNKKLVAGLQAMRIDALGLTGADGDAIRAHKRTVKDIDYGFAGDIDRVNVSFLHELLSNGKIPVFSALTHDGNGQLLNTNADTLASKIASALSTVYAAQLLYCFTKKGVLDAVNDDHSVVEQLDKAQYKQMKKDKKIVAGMIPKLDTAFEALENGVLQVHLGTVEVMSNQALKHTTLCL